MAHTISANAPPKQDHGGDKAPLKSLAQIAASTIPFHPIANIFPLLQGKEFEALVEDVSTNGLVQPITKHDGKILDGRNRYRACLKSGVAPIFHTFSGDDPVAFVVSANLHRRHLTPKQKRELIAKLLKQNPERSNLATAKVAKADDKTVSSVRKELVARSEIPNVETRTDTKGRKQPGSKKSTRGSKSASKFKPTNDHALAKPAAGDEAPAQPAPANVESPSTASTAEPDTTTSPSVGVKPGPVTAAVPEARKPSPVYEVVDRLVEVLGAIQFVDAVRELTQEERKTLSGRVETARRYLGQLKEVLTPARVVS